MRGVVEAYGRRVGALVGLDLDTSEPHAEDNESQPRGAVSDVTTITVTGPLVCHGRLTQIMLFTQAIRIKISQTNTYTK